MQGDAIRMTLLVTDALEKMRIPYKLEWYRMGGETSDLQWRDILGVLKTKAGQLDLEYMRRWAKQLKVEDLLEKVLTDLSC